MRDVAHPVLIFLSSLFTAATLLESVHAQDRASRLRFEITFPAERSRTPLDGRLLLFVSADTADEPRFQISDAPGTQQVFGIDVDGWKPAETRLVDASASDIRSVPSPTCRAVGTVCKRSSIDTKPFAGATDTS